MITIGSICFNKLDRYSQTMMTCVVVIANFAETYISLRESVGKIVIHKIKYTISSWIEETKTKKDLDQNCCDILIYDQ